MKTKKEMINLIRKSLPNLEINDVQVNNVGWDNDILIVNQEIVFRFPKNKHIARSVLTEAKLLNELKKKETIVEVPNYKILYNEYNELASVYYPYINGSPLSGIGAKNINKWKENAKVAADFLSKLHSLAPQQVNISGLPTIHTYDYWNNLYKSVKKQVYPFLNDEQRHEINDTFLRFLDNYSALSFQKTIIHGDLSSSNILYDRGMINGIIDFTDAQLGDPAFDFAGFFWDIGPEFTKQVLTYYDGNESVVSLYKRIMDFYGLQPGFHEMLYAIQHEKRISWDTVMSKFLRLKKISKKYL